MVDSVTIQSSEHSGPTLEEEAAALDAKLSGETTDHGGLPSEKEAKSDLLAGKFKSQDELVKAYKELESKLGGKPSEKPTDAPKEAPKAPLEIKEEPKSDADKVVESAGLDMHELSTEYASKGELAPESYEKLAKVGISKDIVDQYIAGQEALLRAAETEVFASVGGEENMKSMLSWAVDNYTPEEIAAYNNAVNSGNKAMTHMAVKALEARYGASGESREPTRQIGGKAPSASVYRSVAELEADMKDKRYSKDAAYRADVEAKLGRSNIFG